MTVEYIRDGETKTVTFELGELDGKDLAGGNTPGSDEGVLDGVTVTDITPQLRAQLRIPDRLEGALVTEVDPSTPSARDGLREGDVILSLDRRAVRNAEEAVKLSEEIKGPKVLVRIWREGISRYLVIDESE